jgi:hypothetical protein
MAPDGTPVPEELHRSRSPSWRWSASPRVEYMIAVYIAADRVAADPRYGNPATRLADTARQRSAATPCDPGSTGPTRSADADPGSMPGGGLPW